MFWRELFSNQILISSLIAWWLAQVVKVPIAYFLKGSWNYGLWVSTGGMPSSHSALVTSTAVAIGLYSGFDTPAFALATAMAMVVIYDSAGIRRQAGYHAQKINMIFNELLEGHPISEKQLKEVLGHTPMEVVGGVFFGFFVTLIIWLIWK